jgi:hypothetical protein
MWLLKAMAAIALQGALSDIGKEGEHMKHRGFPGWHL